VCFHRQCSIQLLEWNDSGTVNQVSLESVRHAGNNLDVVAIAKPRETALNRKWKLRILAQRLKLFVLGSSLVSDDGDLIAA
jgi:hypothetical protein